MPLKHPNTGLYTFCKDLTLAILNNQHSGIDFCLYLPKNRRNLFSKAKHFIFHKVWHKLFFPSLNKKISVWHNMAQGNNFYPKNKSIKQVLTIHDLNYLIEKKNSPFKIKKYHKRIEKAIEYSSVIVCISEFVKKEVIENFNIEGKIIKVIYNGCEDISQKKESIPSLVPKKNFLFSISSIFPKKNFHVLSSLLVENELELIIAGIICDTKYRDKIIDEAKKFGVESKLHIVGPITESEKNWYYKNCEAFLFPSIAEGFGLPVVEAMHFEKPVFLSKHTSLPEIGGDAAYYFDDFEPITMQKNFKEGMEHFKNIQNTSAIKERANYFTWEKAAQQYLNVYENLTM